jgi:hypothetical protein
LCLTPQCLDVKAVVSGGVVIHIKSGHGIDPYIHLPMPEFTNGWQKIWFFLRNDIVTPLPMFTGNCPIAQLNWGNGVAKKDLNKL